MLRMVLTQYSGESYQWLVHGAILFSLHNLQLSVYGNKDLMKMLRTFSASLDLWHTLKSY